MSHDLMVFGVGLMIGLSIWFAALTWMVLDDDTGEVLP